MSKSRKQIGKNQLRIEDLLTPLLASRIHLPSKRRGLLDT